MTANALPSKRKRTKGGRYSHEITREEIELYYHLPCEEASRQLGIGLTILKRICRRLGIDKWPYRQLKRAGKLGEAAAAAAATGAAAPLPGPLAAPLAAPTPAPAAAPKAPAARKRTPARKKPSAWELREQSTTQEDDTSSQGPGGSSSVSDGSWHAARGAAGADAVAQQGSEPLAPGVPVPGAPVSGRRLSPPSDGASRPRRVSIDLGVAARGGRPASPQLSGSTGGTASGGGSAGGLQDQPSASLKRIREEEFDPLMMAALLDTPTDAAQVSPFSALANAMPDGLWTPGGAAAAAWQPAGGEDAGADQLAAGLSRLAMRTLSLKRQKSRGDAAVDALEQALLLERMIGEESLAIRSCSLPAAAAGPRRHSPPLPRGDALGRKQPRAPAEHGGWLAQEQLRLPGSRQQMTRAGGLCRQLGIYDGEEAGEEGLLPLGDPNLSALLYAASPAPKHAPCSSDLVSEGCMLPEDRAAFAPAAALNHASSAGALLECGGRSGGAAQRGPGPCRAPSGGADGTACGTANVAGTMLEDHTDVYGFPSQLGPAAGVTSVGPAATSTSGRAPTGAGSALDRGSALPSPFTGRADEDCEVDDLLAEFLSPAPSNLAEHRVAELLGNFSPRPSPRFMHLEDPALAGLVRTPRAPAPPTGHAASLAAARAAAAMRGAPVGATAMLAAAALADPIPTGPGVAGSVQGSPLTPAAGSGSVLSHDTPCSSAGPGTMPLMAAPGELELPLHSGSAGSSTTDLLPLLSKLGGDPDRLKQMMASQLMQMQAQRAQRVQAHEAAAAWRPEGHDAEPVPSPGSDELQQAVAQHQAVAQQYLAQRQEVQAMLAQRGSSQHLGSLAGDQERLAQLARLKQLKQQLAAAQARQQALRRHREASAAARAAARSAAFAPQPLSFLSDVSSTFAAGQSAPLGPPPPLPPRAGTPPAGLEGLPASLGAMLQQWRGEQEHAAPPSNSKWSSAVHTSWGPLPDTSGSSLHAASLPPPPPFQASMQPRRAGSAPLVWDFDWAATA